MKNTGIVYKSEDRKPQVVLEFAELLPNLSDEQYTALKADILQNGCYSPVIVDENMRIIDGHNRQRICEENDISYTKLYLLLMMIWRLSSGCWIPKRADGIWISGNWVRLL